MGAKNTKTKQPQGKQLDPKLCPQFEDVNYDEVIKNALGGNDLAEGLPLFNQLGCEDVWAGKNNTWIVLGRDRPAGAASPNLTSTQAGAIDIVVGRLGSAVAEACIDGKIVWADPTFRADAARVYISQKSSIDKDFKLAAGNIGSPGYQGDGKTVQQIPALSGIGVKADQIRIIGRRNIKLVTMGLDEPVSHGKIDKKERTIQGIDIIAGNRGIESGLDFRIEPMVKGERMADALIKLSEIVEGFMGCVHNALIAQDRANAVLADHKHIWGDGSQPTSCGISEMGYVPEEVKQCVDAHADTSMPDYEQQITKLVNFRKDYCMDGGPAYINSKWNFVN